MNRLHLMSGGDNGNQRKRIGHRYIAQRERIYSLVFVHLVLPNRIRNYSPHLIMLYPQSFLALLTLTAVTKGKVAQHHAL